MPTFGGPMVERIITFLVLGFFVFAPEIAGFWAHDPIAWYKNYLVWLALIAACYWSQRREYRPPR